MAKRRNKGKELLIKCLQRDGENLTSDELTARIGEFDKSGEELCQVPVSGCSFGEIGAWLRDNIGVYGIEWHIRDRTLFVQNIETAVLIRLTH